MRTWCRLVVPVLVAWALAGALRAEDDFAHALLRAEAGDREAETLVGVAYARGSGVPRDDAQALAWLTKAAAAGSAGGQAALGALYEKGLGVAADADAAFALYLKSANGGNSNGEELAGECYAEGRGVPKDDGRAVEWFRKAAAQGNPAAQTRLGLAYQNGTGVAQDMQRAFTYFLQAAGRNFAPAQLEVALCYWHGAFVPRDPVKAYAWCSLALRTAPDPTAEALRHDLIEGLSGAQLAEGDALVDRLIHERAGNPAANAVRVAFANGTRAKMPFRNVVNHIVIAAQFQGHDHLLFLVDTGASASFLDEKTANLLGIRGSGTFTTGNGIGRDLLLSAVTNPTALTLPGLAIEGISFRLFSTAAWDRPVGVHLDGILGTDVLRRFALRIDYRRRTIEFIAPAALDVAQAGTRVPLVLKDSLALVEATVTKFDVASQPTQLILDTGSNESFTLSRNFLAANPGLKFSRGAVSYSLGGGGRENETITRCARVRFGDLIILNPLVFLLSENQGLWADGWAGSIGNDILQRFAVTIDFAAPALYLKPNERLETIREEAAGLALQSSGWFEKRPTVAEVTPGGAAGPAGFRIGDILVSIDGRELKGRSLDEAAAFLHAPGRHRVEIDRAGRRTTLNLGS